MDLHTLRSLQIFVEEQHPSNMGIGKSKEGFSVFGMLQAKCTTNMVGVHTGTLHVPIWPHPLDTL